MRKKKLKILEKNRTMMNYESIYFTAKLRLFKNSVCEKAIIFCVFTRAKTNERYSSFLLY